MAKSKQEILDLISGLVFAGAIFIFILIGSGELDWGLVWVILILIGIVIAIRVYANYARKATSQKIQAESQQRRQAEAEARQRAEQEARIREEQEAPLRAAAEARQNTEREHQRLAQEEARMKKLQQIIKVSNKLAVERIAQVLEMSIDETWKRVFDWAEKFQFTIDGDFILFNKDTVSAFIASMDKEFATWHQEGKV